MNLNKKLNEVKEAYESMGLSSNESGWFTDGKRRIADVIIVDDDYELESFFHDRMIRVQKSVRVEGKEIHTRILSMCLFNPETRTSSDYDYKQLDEMKNGI